MTIATFCRDELLAHGPLTLDDLAGRATRAGVTRAKNPQSSLLSVLRYREIELLDGRWVTPAWLLEGRCLTSERLPYQRQWYSERDPDLGLLGTDLTAALPSHAEVGDPSHILCVRVTAGQVKLTSITTPDSGTLELAALADRLGSVTAGDRYGEQRRSGLRAVAQLMVDDSSTFRTPLPPLSTWVPALVEDARRRAEEEQRMIEWHEKDDRRRRGQVVLDDCTAIEVELAAERTGMSTQEWIYAAIDRGLERDRRLPAQPGGVVIALGDRWR